MMKNHCRKYLAKGYSYNSTGLSFLKPNVLEQYYGAGNIYMTQQISGKLITQMQQYKLFSPKITNPLLHEFGQKTVSQMNIDMVSMLSQH